MANDAGTVNVGPQPTYVELATAPTLEFLAEQLQMGEDVELFINGNNGNHYVTLTSLYYDTDDMEGYIDIVDPNQPTAGGPAGTPDITQVDITGFDPTDDDIPLDSTNLAYLGTGLNIVNAVAESPIPEPVSVLL